MDEATENTKSLDIKKLLIESAIVLVGLILIFNAYYFGWRNLTNHFYQQGVQAGIQKDKTDLMNVICAGARPTFKMNLDDNNKCSASAPLKDVYLNPTLQ